MTPKKKAVQQAEAPKDEVTPPTPPAAPQPGETDQNDAKETGEGGQATEPKDEVETLEAEQPGDEQANEAQPSEEQPAEEQSDAKKSDEEQSGEEAQASEEQPAPVANYGAELTLGEYARLKNLPAFRIGRAQALLGKHSRSESQWTADFDRIGG